MNFNQNDNRKKLATLMESYIDEENYNYTLFNEILEKLEIADQFITIIGLIYLSGKGRKKK